MTPFYQDENTTLYCGDCISILAELPQNSVDMIITDPPYFLPNIQFRPAMRQESRQWDANFSMPQRTFGLFLDAIERVAKPDFELYIFGDDLMTSVIYPLVYPRYYNTKTLVWDKGRIGLGGKWRRQFENILYAYRGDVKDGNSGNSDILKFPAVREKTHPYEKPVALLEKILASSKPGIVLDAFCGSGSLLRAARNCGWKSIGMEIEKGNCERIVQNLNNATMQYEAAL